MKMAIIESVLLSAGFGSGFGFLFRMLPSVPFPDAGVFPAGVLPTHLACRRWFHVLDLEVGLLLALFFFQMCPHTDSITLTTG